jgi:DNA-binding CsgD family transcriptional regulator
VAARAAGNGPDGVLGGQRLGHPMREARNPRSVLSRYGAQVGFVIDTSVALPLSGRVLMEWPGRVRHPVPASVAAAGGGGFVGRAAEVAGVSGLVSGVAGGVGGMVLVAGEQGVGKSALLAVALRRAAVETCRVCWGAGDELGQRFPLALMVECLGAEGLLEVRGQERGVLGGDPVLAGAERLCALVERWCAEGPVVVVAEDLQWADEASVLVWRRLARVVNQVPLLLLGSVRPPVERSDLAALMRDTARGGGLMMELGGPAGGEVAELAARLVGGRPGRKLSRVLARAGGNPLYVRELADALGRGGRVRVAEGMAELAGEPGGVGVPVSLAAAIGERLAGLPTVVAGVLRWGAVLGAEFSVADVGLVTGRGAGELAPVVEQAVDAGVLVAAGPRLGFRHGVIRQVLYEGIPGPVRVALHLQAARTLATEGAPAERVAAQLVAAPETGGEWVWEWLARQAPALAYRAPQVAAELLRRALGEVPEADPRREVLEAALVTVAFVLLLVEEMERVARPLLARTADPDRAAEVAWLLAYTLGHAGRPAEAAVVAKAALARPGISQTWAARLRARQAMTNVMLGRMDESEQAAGQALTAAERGGDRFATGYALHALSLHDLYRRDQAAALERVDQALAVIGDDPQTTDLRLMLLANRESWLEDQDRMAEAGATVRDALALAEQTGTHRLGMICTAAADYYLEIGQWDDALVVLETAAAVPGPDYLPILVHGQVALIAGHRDDWDTAEEHLAAVEDQVLDSASLRMVAYCLLLARALAAERAGRPEEAVAALAPCLDPALAQDMPERYLLLPPLTRVALAAGDPATAAAAARAAAEEAGRDTLPVKIAAADVCRALVAGDPGPLLAAATYYESAGRPLHHAGALEDAAVLMARCGDLAAARSAFRRAARIYEGLGAAWDLRRADARLRGHGIRRGRGAQRARPAQGWEALTPTEAKIASLVAVGRSNPDIAAEMFLSRNTVQTHVSHILGKLGARSRGEIIRQALDHPHGQLV